MDKVRTTAPLRSSDALMREKAAIFDAAQDGLIGLTRSGIVRTWNAGATRIFGYSAAEATGLSISMLAGPGYFREQENLLRAACAGERIGPLESRWQDRDGVLLTVEVTLIPLFDTRGQVTTLAASISDITARKRAEAMRNLVVEELNHRINNTIATVGAIAAQTLRNATSLGSFGETFRGRLHSLSTTHNMLARNAWCGTTLAELVATELAPYAGDGIPRWKMSGIDTHVDCRRAEALSMALHELATNALKYGALSVPEGQVLISWEVCAAGAKQRLKFAWVECGGPPVVEPTRKGFGTRLITDGIASQLNGATTLTYAPSGVQYALDVPFEPVEESSDDCQSKGKRYDG